jgi:hypothetical protein
VSDAVDELIDEGRLERVRSDPAAVQRMLQQAALNADGAVREAEARNPSGGHALLWDAVRMAITAHMLSNGLRPTSAPGHHSAVVAYAEARLIALVDADDLDALDRMRRTRHRSEYDAIPVSRATFDADAPGARRIVQGVVGALVER